MQPTVFNGSRADEVAAKILLDMRRLAKSSATKRLAEKAPREEGAVAPSVISELKSLCGNWLNRPSAAQRLAEKTPRAGGAARQLLCRS